MSNITDNPKIQVLKAGCSGVFTNYIYKAIPLAFDESMSYYETLAGLLAYLKDVILPTVNGNAEAVAELQELYITLNDYVTNYFDNLDVQEEINNKLDQMVEDGTFASILLNYTQITKTFDTYNDMMLDTSTYVNGMKLKTLGYHYINDGGGADYVVTNVQSDTKYQVSIGTNLWVELINKEIMTPEMFGAYGDGSHNDSVSIQNLINYGKNVEFLNKTYLCSNIVISNPINIKGNNTLLKVPQDVEIESADSYTENTLIFKISNTSNVQIEGISFDGNYERIAFYHYLNMNAHFSSYGVRITDGSKEITIKNCKFNDFKDAGVQTAQKSSYITIENCIFFDEKFNNSFSRGIQCVQPSTDPTDFDAFITIKNNKIFNCGEHGIVVYFHNNHVLIDGNYLENIGLQHTNPDGTSNFTMGSGIKLSGASNAIITNNLVINAHNDGIECAASTNPSTNIIVSNNRILATNDVIGVGIGCGVNATNVIIDSNEIDGYVISSYSYSGGIAVSSYVSITNNRITNCSLGINCNGNCKINNNFIKVADKPLVAKGENLNISNNYVESTGTNIDGFTIQELDNCIINANLFKNLNRAIIVRVSADNTNIFGNIYDTVTREIYWVSFTPTNSKVDFVTVQ